MINIEEQYRRIHPTHSVEIEWINFDHGVINHDINQQHQTHLYSGCMNTVVEIETIDAEIASLSVDGKIILHHGEV